MQPTRSRIIETGARLFWRQGYVATGMKQVVAEAKAPFGSVYHFVPGGKEELGAEVVRWSGGQYASIVVAAFEVAASEVAASEITGVGYAGVLQRVFALAGDAVRDSGYADACPIATVALEMSGTSEPIREACADTFTDWTAQLADRFAAAGAPIDRCPDLATTFITLLEGSFVLVRAMRTVEPLLAAGRAMAICWEAAVG